MESPRVQSKGMVGRAGKKDRMLGQSHEKNQGDEEEPAEQRRKNSQETGWEPRQKSIQDSKGREGFIQRQ